MDILPDELDSVGKGRTVVASSAVLYTDEDAATAIVDDKPSMRSVRSSTRTKIVNVIQWNLRTKATLGDKPFGLCREVGPCSEVLCQTPQI